jgi:hypothetical protein
MSKMSRRDVLKGMAAAAIAGVTGIGRAAEAAADDGFIDVRRPPDAVAVVTETDRPQRHERRE